MRTTGTDFGASSDPARPVGGIPTTRVLSGHRRPGTRRLRAAPGPQGRAHHQPHRPRRRRHADHRPVPQGARPLAGGALQSRARHPRRPRSGARALDQGRGDRPHHPLALRRDPAAHRRDAAGHRHAGARPAGRRRALLHLCGDDGLRAGGGGQAQDPRRRPRSPQPDRRLADRRPAARRRPAQLHRLHADADPPRHDARRAGDALQRRAQDRRRAHRDQARRLAPRPVVRPHRPAVGEPVAEHAQPQPGDAVPGRRRDRVRQPLGGPRHRSALRADRRAVDRRARAWPRR